MCEGARAPSQLFLNVVMLIKMRAQLGSEDGGEGRGKRVRESRCETSIVTTTRAITPNS